MGRPLRRRTANVDVHQLGKSKPLRRCATMVDMDELLLKRLNRLDVGDERASESIPEKIDDNRSDRGFASVSRVGASNSFGGVDDQGHTGPHACSPGDESVSENTSDVDLGSLRFGSRHIAHDRMTFSEVYDTDKKFVRFVLGLPKPQETSHDLWLFQKYCRQREVIIASSVVTGDGSDEGIVSRREDSVVASSMAAPTAAATACGEQSTRRSARAQPRRTQIAGMTECLAENQYVEREMKRRDFELVNGQWQDGVLLEGDPQSDADLEPFLRTQFRVQQEEARATAWGAGRKLGRR